MQPGWNTTGTEFFIGARVTQGVGFFNGVIDDVAIWDRVLSFSEIQSVAGTSSSDTCVFSIYDTTTVTIYDTITTNITVYDTITTYINVTDTLFIDVATGLQAPDDVNTISVYPNPANTHITIDNGNYLTLGGYELKITNSIGQTVFQSPINQQQFVVDLSTWSGNGIYYVNVIDSGGNTVDIRKIVLQ